MSNAFDRINYTTKEPSKLVLGDFWAWRRDDLASDIFGKHTLQNLLILIELWLIQEEQPLQKI